MEVASVRCDGRPLCDLRVAITGAGGGLGRAFALALARAGAEIALIGRTLTTLNETAEEIAAVDGRASSHRCDITDLAAVETLFDQLGAVDVLLNNAGTNIPRPFRDVTPGEFDEIFAINVKALFFTSQVAARHMLARGRGGVIINVSSQMGHVGAASRTVYCASKHAVEGLTRALAVELAPDGIRVCAIAPTYVATPLTAPFFADAAFAAQVERDIPLGRVATAEEIAAAAVFLASPAAGFITGSSLVIDGGYTAR
jgi:NAD(P)-dependent dehydrogenase (short-subunit alcohol dehydrogenase family)